MRFFHIAFFMFAFHSILTLQVVLTNSSGNRIFTTEFNTTNAMKDATDEFEETSLVRTLMDTPGQIVSDLLNFFVPGLTKSARDLLWGGIDTTHIIMNLLGIPEGIRSFVNTILVMIYAVGFLDFVRGVTGVTT